MSVLIMALLAVAVAALVAQALALIGLVTEIKGLRNDIIVARIVTLPEKAFDGIEPPISFARRSVSVTLHPEPSDSDRSPADGPEAILPLRSTTGGGLSVRGL